MGKGQNSPMHILYLPERPTTIMRGPERTNRLLILVDSEKQIHALPIFLSSVVHI